jgi:hypothetical protein
MQLNRLSLWRGCLKNLDEIGDGLRLLDQVELPLKAVPDETLEPPERPVNLFLRKASWVGGFTQCGLRIRIDAEKEPKNIILHVDGPSVYLGCHIAALDSKKRYLGLREQACVFNSLE